MFGLLGGLSSKIIIGLVILIAVGTGAGLWYFSWSQKEMKLLAANAAKLELSVIIQKETIEDIINQQLKSKQQMIILNTKFQISDKKNKKLEKIVARHRDSIPHIIDRKPKVYENIINRGTRNVLLELEQITDPELYYENTNIIVTE